MNSREVFPNEELRRRIMDFIMAAGQTLLENGAEVFRVEQTMEIMARSFHLREFHVYVLTNGIFASAGTAEISEVRNVPNRTTHLSRVAAVNALSREIAEASMSLDEAESRLVLARRIPFPKDWVQLVSGMCGAFCFALIFGGTLRSALAAALAGFLASGYLLLCEQHELPGAMMAMFAEVGDLMDVQREAIRDAADGKFDDPALAATVEKEATEALGACQRFLNALKSARR